MPAMMYSTRAAAQRHGRACVRKQASARPGAGLGQGRGPGARDVAPQAPQLHLARPPRHAAQHHHALRRRAAGPAAPAAQRAV